MFINGFFFPYTMLPDHLASVLETYASIRQTNLAIDSLGRKVEEAKTTIDLQLPATYGQVPVFPAGYLDAFSRLTVTIDYSIGDAVNRFNFVEREIPTKGWGGVETYNAAGYFKEPAIDNDKPIRIVVDILSVKEREVEIARDNKKRYLVDSMKFYDLGDGKLTRTPRYKNRGNGKKKGVSNPEIVEEFYDLMKVCQSFLSRKEYYGSQQDIANRTIVPNDIGVMNSDVYSAGILFEAGGSSKWPVARKMDYVSNALKLFFEEKGYPIAEIDLGKVHSNLIADLAQQKEDKKTELEGLEVRLKSQNVLGLSEVDCSQLLSSFAYLSQLRLELSVEDLHYILMQLPREYSTPILNDFSIHIHGLQNALRKNKKYVPTNELILIRDDLLELNRKVSPSDDIIFVDPPKLLQ